MQNVPEGFFHQTIAQRQSGIYETDPPSSLSYPRIQITWSTTSPKCQDKSEADRSLTKKVSEINMQHSQAGWASALHSLLCLNVTFNGHLLPQSI